jgi:hypothetical protein
MELPVGQLSSGCSPKLKEMSIIKSRLGDLLRALRLDIKFNYYFTSTTSLVMRPLNIDLAFALILPALFF